MLQWAYGREVILWRQWRQRFRRDACGSHYMTFSLPLIVGKIEHLVKLSGVFVIGYAIYLFFQYLQWFQVGKRYDNYFNVGFTGGFGTATAAYFVYLRLRRFWHIPVNRVYEKAMALAIRDPRVLEVLGSSPIPGDWRAQQVRGGFFNPPSWRKLWNGQYSVLRDFCGVKLVPRCDGLIEVQHRRVDMTFLLRGAHGNEGWVSCRAHATHSLTQPTFEITALAVRLKRRADNGGHTTRYVPAAESGQFGASASKPRENPLPVPKHERGLFLDHHLVLIKGFRGDFVVVGAEKEEFVAATDVVKPDEILRVEGTSSDRLYVSVKKDMHHTAGTAAPVWRPDVDKSMGIVSGEADLKDLYLRAPPGFVPASGYDAVRATGNIPESGRRRKEDGSQKTKSGGAMTDSSGSTFTV
jgi:hypothetical protein